MLKIIKEFYSLAEEAEKLSLLNFLDNFDPPCPKAEYLAKDLERKKYI